VWLKRQVLRLFLTMACAADSIHQNSLLKFFIQVDVFKPVALLLLHPETRHTLDVEAILLITLLANFRKVRLSAHGLLCVCVCVCA
jgi:hypothetical protein